MILQIFLEKYLEKDNKVITKYLGVEVYKIIKVLEIKGGIKNEFNK